MAKRIMIEAVLRTRLITKDTHSGRKVLETFVSDPSITDALEKSESHTRRNLLSVHKQNIQNELGIKHCLVGA